LKNYVKHDIIQNVTNFIVAFENKFSEAQSSEVITGGYTMENKGKKLLKWENTKLEIGETLKKGEYEELLKYVKENERVLMTEVASYGLSDTVRHSLKYGTSKMVYFEKTIEEDNETYALFKLGELYGYINCLNKLAYEEDWYTLAKARLADAKTYDRANPDLIEAVIKYLYSSRKDGTAKGIANAISSNERDIQITLNILRDEGFLNYYESFGYSLSDLGIKLGKILSLK